MPRARSDWPQECSRVRLQGWPVSRKLFSMALRLDSEAETSVMPMVQMVEPSLMPAATCSGVTKFA